MLNQKKCNWQLRITLEDDEQVQQQPPLNYDVGEE
jgi:hypothetical protein